MIVSTKACHLKWIFNKVYLEHQDGLNSWFLSLGNTAINRPLGRNMLLRLIFVSSWTTPKLLTPALVCSMFWSGEWTRSLLIAGELQIDLQLASRYSHTLKVSIWCKRTARNWVIICAKPSNLKSNSIIWKVLILKARKKVNNFLTRVTWKTSNLY